MNTIIVEKLVKHIQAEFIPESSHSQEIEGISNTDKLENLTAAIWIADKMQMEQLNFQSALNLYLNKKKLV